MPAPNERNIMAAGRFRSGAAASSSRYVGGTAAAFLALLGKMLALLLP